MPCRTSGPSAYPARTPRSSTRPATGRSSGRGAGRHRDRHLEQGQDAGGRRAAALVEVEDLGDLGQRPEQALGHEDQHGVEADLEVAAQRRPAAEQQRAGEAGQDRHPDQRHERGRGPDRVGVGAAVGQGDGRHAVALAVLGGERLDGRDAGDVGGERAGQVGDRGADPVVERLEATLEDERPDDDQRDRQEGEDQELARRGREDGPDEQHVERGLQDRRRADVEEALELVDVVVEGGERRARPGGSRATRGRGAGRGRTPPRAGRARRPAPGRATGRWRRTRSPTRRATPRR